MDLGVIYKSKYFYIAIGILLLLLIGGLLAGNLKDKVEGTAEATTPSETEGIPSDGSGGPRDSTYSSLSRGHDRGGFFGTLKGWFGSKDECPFECMPTESCESMDGFENKKFDCEDDLMICCDYPAGGPYQCSGTCVETLTACVSAGGEQLEGACTAEGAICCSEDPGLGDCPFSCTIRESCEVDGVVREGYECDDLHGSPTVCCEMDQSDTTGGPCEDECQYDYGCLDSDLECMVRGGTTQGHYSCSDTSKVFCDCYGDMPDCPGSCVSGRSVCEGYEGEVMVDYEASCSPGEVCCSVDEPDLDSCIGDCVRSQSQCDGYGGHVIDNTMCETEGQVCCDVDMPELVECPGSCVESRVDCYGDILEQNTECLGTINVFCCQESILDPCPGECVDSPSLCDSWGGTVVEETICDNDASDPYCCSESTPVREQCPYSCTVDLAECDDLGGEVSYEYDCTPEEYYCCNALELEACPYSCTVDLAECDDNGGVVEEEYVCPAHGNACCNTK